MSQTVKGFFDSLAPKLNSDPDALSGLDCVYQFHIGEGRYHVTIRGGKAQVAEGDSGSPNCTVSMEEGTLLDLLAGKINGQMAFLTGKIKVAGDMGLALKLGSIIKA